MAQPLVCYTAGYNYVTSTNQFFPCGASDVSGASAQACCYSEDYCMEDSICHYTRGGVTNGTGYYMAGCTDPTWKDPACPKECTSEHGTDIIYDPSNSAWRCCQSTDKSLDCQDPTDFFVQAAGPKGLSTVIQLTTPVPSSVATTGVGSITSSNTATSTSSSATTSRAPIPPSASKPTHTSDSSSSTSLSTGAIAGIAVGGILGALAIIAAIFFLYRKHRSKPQNQFEKYPSEERPQRPASPKSMFSFSPESAFFAYRSGHHPRLPSNLRLSRSTPKLPNKLHAQDSYFPAQPSALSPLASSRSPLSRNLSLGNPNEPEPTGPLSPSLHYSTAPQSPNPQSTNPRYSTAQSLAPPSPSLQRDPRRLTRDSDMAISFQEGVIYVEGQERFSQSYEDEHSPFGDGDGAADGDGPYEMESEPNVKHRMPYQRPLSAQELEGTKVQLQELEGNMKFRESAAERGDEDG